MKTTLTAIILLIIAMSGCNDSGSSEKPRLDVLVGEWQVNYITRDTLRYIFIQGDVQITADDIQMQLYGLIAQYASATFGADFTATGHLLNCNVYRSTVADICDQDVLAIEYNIGDQDFIRLSWILDDGTLWIFDLERVK
jgi:hypothetical protein